jgi:hypothetical protein
MKRISLLALTALLALIAAGCTRPPEAQIQQATSALQAAQAAGAPTYAPEAWSGAQQAMDQLNAELKKQGQRFSLFRSYARARSLAQTVVTDADQARTQAESKIAQLRSDATKTIAELRNTLQSARNQLAAVPRAAGLDTAALKTRLDRATQQLDQAQADLNAGQFDRSTASAAQARDNITAVLRAIEQVSGRAPSRKR